jgi:hypothetical protein
MNKTHRFCISIILFLDLAAMPARAFGGADLSENMPARDTPQKLVEAWLRFHETDLCQEVDAVFIFENNGMEVWFVYAGEASYLRMQELFKPLQDSYRVELYPTRRLEQKKFDDDDDGPPPSIYMNYELRGRMGTIDASSLEQLNNLSPIEGARYRARLTSQNEALESRLTIFARQIIDWNRKAKRYAMELPLLAGTAFDSTATPGTRAQAVNICKAHAKQLGKNISKLKANLKQALPRLAEKERLPKPEKSDKGVGNPIESAEQISEVSQNIAQRVYRFLYPEQHTVNLSELRQPSLLVDLSSLERTILDFQKELPNLPQGKKLSADKSGLRGAR